MSDIKHITTTKFSDFDLPEPLLAALTEHGFEFCTPIQERTIPLSINGKDLMGQAQTGTGKTIAFLVALMTKLHREPEKKGLRALILAPTRELAIQIHAEAELLNSHLKLKMALAYGGKDYEKQRETIASGIDILIGTPGRIIDFYKQKVFNLNSVDVLVLDEADRMFDLGFVKDIRYLLNKLPPAQERLNLLFSATFSYDVQELSYQFTYEPDHIVIEAQQVTASQIEERVYLPAATEKIALLKWLVQNEEMKHAMVFVNTKATGERVHETLRQLGFNNGWLSGDAQQSKREKLLAEFKSFDLQLLIATDVAARGIHVDDVDYVINYDLPQQAEDYVHRIGRTARAGASGKAISFACEDYAITLPDIEAYIEHKLPVAKITAEMVDATGIPNVKIQRNRRPTRQDGSKPTRSGKPHSAHKSSGDAAKTSHTATQKPRQENPRREPTKQIETPKTPMSNLDNRMFSSRGYEIPAIG